MNQSSPYDNQPLEPLPPLPGEQMRIPLHKPFMTYVFLGSIIIIGIGTEFFGLDILKIYGANIGEYVLNGEYWRLFTSMFLHGGLQHLAFNAFALIALGIEMERIYGVPRYTVVYILTGLFGSLASVGFRGTEVVSLGASGAIFGIVGMNLAYFLLHKDALGEFGRQRMNSTLLIIGINLVFGFIVPRIDNFAHIGGLIAGFIIGYGLAPRYKTEGEYTGNLRLEDQTSLLNRWWVPAIAVAVLVFGIQMAQVFWLGGLAGV